MYNQNPAAMKMIEHHAMQLQGSDVSHIPNAIIPTQFPIILLLFLSQTTIFQ